jgi:penicillin amidase
MTPSEETIAIAGLAGPASIHVDRWGIPHLKAGSLDDLFLVQGFNAARDRLWQIDLWRKRGLGLLAADFGPGFLAQDRASRLFLYRGDMDAEWAAYAPDARAICTAFVAGINAYVGLTEREPDRVPPEFGTLGTRPARWAPEDVVRIRTHALSRNAISELQRANVLARAGARTDLLRRMIEPLRVPEPPAGLDLASLPPEALDAFKLATAGVTFSPERLAASLDQAFAWTRVDDLGEVIRDAAMEGSNNWVIHGSRTATGRPVMGSDPHRTHAVPSLRYLVHLSSPEFDAIGAGEPAVPGMSLGHNGRSAFSLTIFNTDQEDVYVYETAPGDPDAYRYGDGRERMHVVEERFAVKGAPDQTLALKFTRHGPVVFEEASKRLAVAVRSVWWEPGSAPYLVSLSSMRAQSLDEFRAAMRRWGTPSVNQVYADVTGTIAWMPAGYAPVRPNWDGLLPVPGDGRYEWAGMRDHTEMPSAVDPARGFLATANEMNLPQDWPHDEKKLGFEFTESSRAVRIHEALDQQKQHSIADSCALQTDVLSVPARRLCSILASVTAEDRDASRALALLRDWDFRLEVDSAAAALFEVWWTKHLKGALFAALAPDAAVRATLLPGDPEGILQALERPDDRFGADPRRGRDALLIGTLAAAFRDCAERMGSEPARWAWGKLHHGFFEHALARVAPAQDADVGPLPKGGSASTPMHTGYRASDFRVIVGASVRMAVDVGAWDNSVCINAPGQAGDPRSPHYGDLAPLWAEGRYVPMLYSWPRIEEATTSVLRLVPA